MKFVASFGAVLALSSSSIAAKWTNNGNYWSSTMGLYSVSVAPKNAGKVVSFQYKKLDVIRPGEAEGAYFWPAPQHAWNWPPPASFTDSTYAVSFAIDSSEITLKGPVNPTSKLRVTKKYRFDPLNNTFSSTYTTTNTATDSVRHFGPWEISRAFTGSLLFFPKATNFKFVNPPGSGLQPDLPLTKDDSLGWFQDGTNGSSKFFRDGAEGWLAQIKDSLLFVKTYPDVDSAKFPPWESDVEVYTSGQFIENEIIGPWTAIKPGDSLVWTVQWTCQIMPKGFDPKIGSTDLKAAARGLAKQATTSSNRPLSRTFTPTGVRPLVDVRGRLLPKSNRVLQSGGLGVLPIR